LSQRSLTPILFCFVAWCVCGLPEDPIWQIWQWYWWSFSFPLLCPWTGHVSTQFRCWATVSRVRKVVNFWSFMAIVNCCTLGCVCVCVCVYVCHACRWH
jgi:hypothetical protein